MEDLKGVEDVCENWRQLISTVLEGGWRVWPSCFVGVLPVEQSVNFSLLNGRSCLCGGGGLWGGQV